MGFEKLQKISPLKYLCLKFISGCVTFGANFQGQDKTQFCSQAHTHTRTHIHSQTHTQTHMNSTHTHTHTKHNKYQTRKSILIRRSDICYRI